MRSSGLDVNVISHKMQRYAVWYGGSLLGSSQTLLVLLQQARTTKNTAPSIVRKFSVFGSV